MDQKSFSSPALWVKREEKKPMRYPNLNANLYTNTHTGASTSTSNEIDVANSTLKPEAPEFIPKSLKNEPKVYSQNVDLNDVPKVSKGNVAQNRLVKIRNIMTASESNDMSYPQFSESEATNGYYEHESTDMMRLKQIISSLIIYPGQFDDLLVVFMESIYPYFDDIMAMSEIAQLLVNEAINSPNFHYNGARLCWYVEQKCAEFRAALHLKCQKELKDNPKQQNIVLFIAELYTQLPHDSLYGALLIESLQKLLTMGGGDNVKCVCQALKLTGYSLEENNQEALDELFARLRSFRNTVSDSVLTILNSVINLRELKWGRNTVESSHSSESSECDQDYEEIVNGILYESNGEVLTNEENEFLAAYATNNEYLIDNEDPDALCDPEPEMDEEIQAAFEEFVKFSKG